MRSGGAGDGGPAQLPGLPPAGVPLLHLGARPELQRGVLARVRATAAPSHLAPAAGQVTAHCGA